MSVPDALNNVHIGLICIAMATRSPLRPLSQNYLDVWPLTRAYQTTNISSQECAQEKRLIGLQ